MTEQTQIPVTQIETPAEPISVSDADFKHYVAALPQDRFDKFGPDQHNKVDPATDWNPTKLALARTATMALHGVEMLGGKGSLHPDLIEARRKQNERLGMR